MSTDCRKGFHPLPTVQLEKLRPSWHSSDLNAGLPAQHGSPTICPPNQETAELQTMASDLSSQARQGHEGRGKACSMIIRPDPGSIPVSQRI